MSSDRSRVRTPPTKPPHPATAAQRRPDAQAPAAMPPHPAKVAQKKTMPPHPAKVAQKKTAPGMPAAMPPHPATVAQRAEAPHPAKVVQRRALRECSPAPPRGSQGKPGSVVQAAYYFYNSDGTLTYQWWPASVTPGIFRAKNDDGTQKKHKGYDVWWGMSSEADYQARRVASQAQHVAIDIGNQVAEQAGQVVDRVQDVARQAADVVIDINEPGGAERAERTYPVATRVMGIVGKAAAVGGVVLMGGLIAQQYIQWVLPPEVQLALNLTSLGLALARIGKGTWEVRQATRNNQPVWLIKTKLGLDIVVSTAVFAIEITSEGWGLAFFGWHKEVFDLFSRLASCVKSCCTSSGERQPLLENA